MIIISPLTFSKSLLAVAIGTSQKMIFVSDRAVRFAIQCILGLACLVTEVYASPFDGLGGAVVTNLGWFREDYSIPVRDPVNVAYQEGILDAGANIGLSDVRLTARITNAGHSYIDHAAHAQSLGMEVNLTYPFSYGGDDFMVDGATKVSGGDITFDAFRASDLDLTKVRSGLHDSFTRMNDAGVTPETIIMFNEFNWAGFNRDLPLPGAGQGRYYTNADWNDPDFAQWREGIDMIGGAFKVAREELDSVFGTGAVKLANGGINYPDLPFVQSAGYSAVAPDITLQLLEGTHQNSPGGSENYLQYLDNYNFHFYPGFGEISDPGARINAALTYVDDFLSLATDSLSEQKPLNISEWGFHQWPFGGDEEARMAALRSVVIALGISGYDVDDMHLFELFANDVSRPYDQWALIEGDEALLSSRFFEELKRSDEGSLFYQDWAAYYRLDSGGDDDPDEDGFTNLEEFLQLSDPLDASPVPSPSSALLFFIGMCCLLLRRRRGALLALSL